MKAKIIDMAWDEAVEPVDNLYLVKKVLAYELWKLLWQLSTNANKTIQSADLKTRFKNEGKLRVTEDYLDVLWQELNLLDGKTEVDTAGLKKILIDIISKIDDEGIEFNGDKSKFIEGKIGSLSVPLTEAHFAATTVQDFTTTRRLASCYLPKWNDTKPEELIV